ncbi:MAG: transporter substrate-binding domain-containing protein [Rhodospirillales bacterium]|nr:transporter substrate-binding domain-containing protein [Rhodospirillales bacterium]
MIVVNEISRRLLTTICHDENEHCGDKPMQLIKILCVCTVMGLAANNSKADDAAAKRELVPTDKLRVAIAVAPTPSVFFTAKDGTTGQYRGVTVDLAGALAKKLGIPLELVPYANSGGIVAAVKAGSWDVTFVPVDEERRKVLAFGSPYYLLQSTYLVAPGSNIATLADANRSGVRIVAVKDTATMRASMRSSPNAIHTAVAGPAEAVTAVREGQADAMAFGSESLVKIASDLPGSRVLDGAFLNSTIAVAVPKDKQAALAYVRTFIDEVIVSGFVRRAFDNVGAKTSVVPPIGTNP